MITLRNDFHNSSVKLRASVGDKLTSAQIKRANRSLCGISECTCSGDLGVRGPQDVSLDYSWDRQGQLQVVILSDSQTLRLQDRAAAHARA